jgi:hypothetical protein
LRFQEKKEKELEKYRNEMFNHYRPMVSQGREWRAKVTSQPELVKQAVRRGAEAVRPASLETPLDFISSTPMACDNEL